MEQTNGLKIQAFAADASGKMIAARLKRLELQTCNLADFKEFFLRFTYRFISFFLIFLPNLFLFLLWHLLISLLFYPKLHHFRFFPLKHSEVIPIFLLLAKERKEGIS